MWVLDAKIGGVDMEIEAGAVQTAKICPRCGLEKPLDEFMRDASKASGYGSRCKACDNEKRHAAYAREHPGARRRPRRSLPAGTRRCYVCEKVKPATSFRLDCSRSGGRASRCRQCDDENRRERHAAARQRAIRVYGGHCVICGSRKELEFDHIDWDGAEHRRSENHKRMIRRIARTGAPIPEYRLRLLCVDCHRARSQALRETLVDGPFDAERVDKRLRELRHDAIYRYA